MTSGTYYVVEDDRGEIVGAGGWTRSAPGGQGAAEGVGHIRHVVTDHARVREGIGRVLMQRIVMSAEYARLSRLDCLSTITAVPFYATCGFVEMQPVSVNLRPGIDFPAVLMRRSVKSIE